MNAWNRRASLKAANRFMAVAMVLNSFLFALPVPQAARAGTIQAGQPAIEDAAPSEKIDPELRAEPGFGGWWGQVQQDIQADEYEPSLQAEDGQGREFAEPAWHFANRAQNLRSYVSPAGWRLEPRELKDGAASWQWLYALDSIGRDGEAFALPAPASGDISADDSGTISIDRLLLSEWYRNSAEGIEQGFTVGERLSGDGPLNISAKISTGLSVNSAGSDQVTFSTATGDAFRLGGLKVTDADGQELAAHFIYDSEKSTLTVAVDDADAAYPITVDPLATSAAWTKEGNQATAYFGWSVASAGDVNGDGYSDVIIGAYLYDNGETDEGAAFVYHGSSTGLSATPDWTGDSDQVDARFGRFVASAGDVNGDGYSDVIVGAPYYDNGTSDEGAAFVYHGSSTGLSATPDWIGDSDQASSQYGVSVASAGDVNGDGYSDVIVGAYMYDNGQMDEGRAFVYNGSASGLSATPDWTAESDQANAWFGYSVASAGDVNGDGYSDVIVGAVYYDNGQTDEGWTFAFHGSASGLSATPDWTAEPDLAYTLFGISVASAGDVNGDGYSDVVVGAYGYDGPGLDNEGRAYVYHGSASGLAGVADWTADPSDQAGAYYGRSVASAGDVNGDGYSDVIVGAFYYDYSLTDDGQAYVYHGSASGLSAAADWTAHSDQASTRFGIGVASAGDVNGDGYSDVIVGAYMYDNGQTDEGRAFVYNGSASGLDTDAAWTKESNQANANFGWSVASAGDVNGDGYSDVIVGAYMYDNGQDGEGAAFVYHGSSSGLSAAADWTAESDQEGASFGWSVASAGDVNGDGYSDVIVGSPWYDNGQQGEGAAFVYHGSSSGLSAAADWTAESDQDDAEFGTSVASAGDVNGDGYSDVIVGVEYYSNGEDYEGAAFVYHGSASGLSASADWMAESDQVGANLGASVASAGDVNGDGYSDVIVGAIYYDNGQDGEGAAFVYHGSASGLSASADWTAESNQASAYFGTSVASAGDVNGDGYADVIVGAPNYDNGQMDEGRVFVYHGASGGLAGTPDWTAELNQMQVTFGDSVASAGDVNGDGYADVIVGASLYDNGKGAAFVYHGSASGLAGSAAWTAGSGQNSASYGHSVASAGDVNGDGYSDVIVGARYYDGGQNDEGKTYVYYGNDGGGMALNPRQLRTDGSALPTLGMSDSSSSFRISAKARPFTGRTTVKLQWEVKARGTAFSGTNLGSSSLWTDSTVSGATVTATVGGLSPGAYYHWRARFVYRSPTLQFSSPWFSAGPNGWNEADLRTHHPSPATTVNSTLFSRTQSGSAGVDFSLSFTLPSAQSTPLVVNFPSGFTVTQAFTAGSCASGHVDTFGYAPTTLTAEKDACSGLVTLSGAKVTNPSAPGVYVISWVNDAEGEIAVYITDSDQVTVSASVDPSFSFAVGATADACSTSFSPSDYAVALGILSASAPTTSGAGGVKHVCTLLSTNGTGGAAVTVSSLNTSLKSASTPGDAIDGAAVEETISAAEEKYGLCLKSDGGKGHEATTPDGSDPAPDPAYDGSLTGCTTSAHDVGPVLAAPQNLWTVPGTTSKSFATVYLKASISATTPAHNDYTDTLTFLATGTF